MSAAEARQAAQVIIADVIKGPSPARAPTLQAALDAYLSRSKLRSEAHKNNLRGIFKNYLSDWLPLPLDRITKEMVRERFDKIKTTRETKGKRVEGGSVFMANEAMQLFRTVYNHDEKISDASLPRCPTVAIEFDQPEPKKENFANRLKDWRAAVDALEQPIHRTLYRFLPVTGLRRTEALSLTWGVEGEDLDTVTEGRVYQDFIYLPMTKNGRPFALPLLPEQQAVRDTVRGLSARWRQACEGHAR